MSKKTIIVAGEVFSDREKLLYHGHREVRRYGPFVLTLYWEPHFESNAQTGQQELSKSFTIDLDAGMKFPGRLRFARLRDADARIAELDEQLLIELGKLAFRITDDDQQGSPSK